MSRRLAVPLFQVVTGAGLSGANALMVDVVNTDNSTWMFQLLRMLNFRFEAGKTYRISFMNTISLEK